MKRYALMLVAVMLLAGCGGDEAEEPELSVAPFWGHDDVVAVDVDTNLPDGAVLSYGIFDGADEDDLESESRSGTVVISDGRAVVEEDVSTFTSDEVVVEVAFIPGFVKQPDEVQERYDEGTQFEAVVPRSES